MALPWQNDATPWLRLECVANSSSSVSRHGNIPARDDLAAAEEGKEHLRRTPRASPPRNRGRDANRTRGRERTSARPRKENDLASRRAAHAPRAQEGRAQPPRTRGSERPRHKKDEHAHPRPPAVRADPRDPCPAPIAPRGRSDPRDARGRDRPRRPEGRSKNSPTAEEHAHRTASEHSPRGPRGRRPTLRPRLARKPLPLLPRTALARRGSSQRPSAPAGQAPALREPGGQRKHYASLTGWRAAQSTKAGENRTRATRGTRTDHRPSEAEPKNSRRRGARKALATQEGDDDLATAGAARPSKTRGRATELDTEGATASRAPLGETANATRGRARHSPRGSARNDAAAEAPDLRYRGRASHIGHRGRARPRPAAAPPPLSTQRGRARNRAARGSDRTREPDGRRPALETQGDTSHDLISAPGGRAKYTQRKQEGRDRLRDTAEADRHSKQQPAASPHSEPRLARTHLRRHTEDSPAPRAPAGEPDLEPPRRAPAPSRPRAANAIATRPDAARTRTPRKRTGPSAQKRESRIAQRGRERTSRTRARDRPSATAWERRQYETPRALTESRANVERAALDTRGTSPHSRKRRASHATRPQRAPTCLAPKRHAPQLAKRRRPRRPRDKRARQHLAPPRSACPSPQAERKPLEPSGRDRPLATHDGRASLAKAASARPLYPLRRCVIEVGVPDHVVPKAPISCEGEGHTHLAGVVWKYCYTRPIQEMADGTDACKLTAIL
ncbi:serine/arginine repetitive matrix protein 1-like [Penaeus chinensis]|uniref:serine/arginine repetitive matrix protein 1-like n=1 Tax=Penaeus chinensis TaxID=139456 RepID=UPI001FB78419|nr:serine/arginine repetitive matrix protein 1-like [Penaeus chinensis]